MKISDFDSWVTQALEDCISREEETAEYFRDDDPDTADAHDYNAAQFRAALEHFNTTIGGAKP